MAGEGLTFAEGITEELTLGTLKIPANEKISPEILVRRQIQHMIKYRYVPFSLGKTRYSSAR